MNGNLIEKLPTSLVRLKGVLTRLKAHDNPMRVPPMYVIHKGTRATLDFLNDVLEGTVEPQLTLKLLLVGQENVSFPFPSRYALPYQRVFPDCSLGWKDFSPPCDRRDVQEELWWHSLPPRSEGYLPRQCPTVVAVADGMH